MTNWSGSSANSNGTGLELGLVLGRLGILNEQQITLLRAQTDILEDIKETLDQVPHKIAEKLPPPVSVTPAKPPLSYIEILDIIRRTGLCLLPVSLVLLLLTGKITLIEAVSLLKQAFGAGG